VPIFSTLSVFMPNGIFFSPPFHTPTHPYLCPHLVFLKGITPILFLPPSLDRSGLSFLPGLILIPPPFFPTERIVPSATLSFPFTQATQHSLFPLSNPTVEFVFVFVWGGGFHFLLNQDWTFCFPLICLFWRCSNLSPLLSPFEG